MNNYIEIKENLVNLNNVCSIRYCFSYIEITFGTIDTLEIYFEKETECREIYNLLKIKVLNVR